MRMVTRQMSNDCIHTMPREGGVLAGLGLRGCGWGVAGLGLRGCGWGVAGLGLRACGCGC